MQKGILVNQTYISARPTGISRVAFSLIEEMVKRNGKLLYLSTKGDLFEIKPNDIVPFLKNRIFPELRETKFKKYQLIRSLTTKVLVADLVLNAISMFFDYIIMKKNEKILIPFLIPIENYMGSILLTEPIINRSIFSAFTRYLQRNEKVQTCMICHDIIALRNPNWFTNLAKNKNNLVCSNYLKIDRIICISNYTYQTLVEYFGMNDNFIRKTQVVIPLGSPLPSKFGNNQMEKVKKSQINVVYVSAINPRKNHVLVAEVLSKIANAQNPICLRLIAGDSWGEKEILNKLEQTVNNHFQYHIDKRVSEDELILSYQESDFSIYLSLEEGFGLPVLESLSQGCPVVCSNTSSLQEFSNLPGVLTVDPKNPKQIQQILTELVTKAEYRNNLKNEIDSNAVRSLKDFAKDVLDYV